jgi:glycosyltransferase involved in cell wall biosynthesis
MGVRFGLAEKRMAPLIRAWLSRYFEHDTEQSRGPRAALVTTARWAPLLRDIPFDVMVYDKTDIPNSLRGHYRLDEYADLEREIIEQSQLLIATSGPLADDLKALSGGREVTVIPNGVDLTRFDKDRLHPVEELENLPRPRLGVVATIRDWIDTDWLGEAARRHPQWSFVVVGPVTKTADMTPLEGLSNVHLLGKKPPEEVPSIIESLDVCLHLLREGPVRDVNRSTKVWEYLALGKPLVCSWIPDLAAYDPLLYRCKDLSHFFENLEVAVQEKDPSLEQERRGQAERNTWESRVNVLFNLLDQRSS